MTQNQVANELAKTFFSLTERRATAATFTQTIGQAKALLNAGFSKEEIISAIQYCIDNPPPKGFNSLGWLSYTIEDVLRKIKAKQAKEQIEKIAFVEPAQEVDVDANRRKIERKGDDSKSSRRADYNFELFK